MVVSCLFFCFQLNFYMSCETYPHNGTDFTFARYFLVFARKVAFERRLKKRFFRLRDDVTLKAGVIKNAAFYIVHFFTFNERIRFCQN
uniref:Secreted protein n=1 Tax=Ixodes ricinus TaxID=34613 RepID=A0A0K8RE27_IXORI